MKIGFFGGTFDPIHFGHLSLAIQLSEIHRLDEVWFCPNQVSPLKGEKPKAPGDARAHMVQLAIEPIAAFRMVDVELRRPPPSYTIDTIRELLQEGGGQLQFHLILGEDALATLSQWKEHEALLRLAPPLIGARSFNQGEGITKISTMEISATEVRKRLQKGLFCGHLVPAKVLDYIYLKNLYEA